MDGHDRKHSTDNVSDASPSWADLTAAERARIEFGSAEVAAGRYYDEEEMDAFFAALDLDPDSPLPPLKQR